MEFLRLKHGKGGVKAKAIKIQYDIQIETLIFSVKIVEGMSWNTDCTVFRKISYEEVN